MKKRFASFGLLVLFLVNLSSLLPVETFAQAAENQQSYLVKVGSYDVIVTIESSNLKTGQAVPFQIKFARTNPADSSPLNLSLAVEEIPSTDISANSLRIATKPAPDGQSWQGSLNYPVSGPWSLKLTLTGPSGSVSAATPFFSVAAPPAIPVWLAWLIALTPSLFFALFLVYLIKKAGLYYSCLKAEPGWVKQ